MPQPFYPVQAYSFCILYGLFILVQYIVLRMCFTFLNCRTIRHTFANYTKFYVCLFFYSLWIVFRAGLCFCINLYAFLSETAAEAKYGGRYIPKVFLKSSK